MSLLRPRDALFPSPSAEMLSSQVSVPRQVVQPAHPYACCNTWNSMHLLVGLRGCASRRADRMSLASRPVSKHGCADWEKGATKILRAGWCTAANVDERLHRADKVDSVSISPERCSDVFPQQIQKCTLKEMYIYRQVQDLASYSAELEAVCFTLLYLLRLMWVWCSKLCLPIPKAFFSSDAVKCSVIIRIICQNFSWCPSATADRKNRFVILKTVNHWLMFPFFIFIWVFVNYIIIKLCFCIVNVVL